MKLGTDIEIERTEQLETLTQDFDENIAALLQDFETMKHLQTLYQTMFFVLGSVAGAAAVLILMWIAEAVAKG